MAEKLAKSIVGIFGSITSLWYGKYLVMFIISLMPILELRGGLIAAALMDAPIVPSFIVCFLGNIIPIPFILLFIEKIFSYLKKRGKFLGKLVTKIEKRATSKKDQIERLKYLGLILFVGVPLPGTGAWTGCLIASLLGMDKKKSCLAAIVGVIMAGIIMLIFSYGILGGILK